MDGDLSAFADFELYKIIDEEIEDSLVGIVANGGVKISGKSAHFTNQVIGSIYTGKSGVEIENIQKALKTKPQVLDEILYYTLDDICEVWVDSSTKTPPKAAFLCLIINKTADFTVNNNLSAV